MIFKKSEILDYSKLNEDTLLVLLDRFKKKRKFKKDGFECDEYKGWHDRAVELALDKKNKRHKKASYVAALGRALSRNNSTEDIFTKSIRNKIELS